MTIRSAVIREALERHLDPGQVLRIEETEDNTFTIQVVHDDQQEEAERKAFEHIAQIHDFSPDLFNKTVYLGRSGPFRIIGVNPRAPKNPVVMTHARTGHEYRASGDHMKVATIIEE